MNIKTLPVGQLETNCYIVTNEDLRRCVVIDPGDESNTILNYIEDLKLKCDAILLTHGHFDHVGAVETVAEETGAAVYMSEKDDFKNGQYPSIPFSLGKNGHYISDGEHISAAGLDFDVIETPGHTPGSVCFICGDAIFTGDTLFRGSCGRVDLPYSSETDMKNSMRRLCAIEGSYDIYPGHMESSTLEREKLLNYYCRSAMADKK